MRRRLTAGVALAILLLPVLAPGAARAAEYEMATVASYVVDPVAGTVAVSVEVTFTNTTPNPSGQLSGFDRIDLAIHEGASEVAAEDTRGALAVEMVDRDGVQVASVKPRARVRYNKSVTFTLSYLLADGSTPAVHVRSQVVKFAAFGFGTSSEVSVELPASYEVRADGDPMVTDPATTVLRLTSGPISDPASWLALVTATRPGTYVTHSASVALASATVDLQVRAWSDDTAWGDRTLATLVAALPLLETQIGLPYPLVGPLVVTEAVGGEGSADAVPASNAEVEVAFDATDFTLLHQAAHVWIGEGLASDRWLREGLASHYAALAAAELGVALPYDPAARATELAADALPLADWGVVPTGAGGDAYAYAASWATVDQVATAVAEAHLAAALQRVAAGISAYDPVPPVAVAANSPGYPPVDTRRFLDQLAAASGIDLAQLFGDTVLGAGSDLELEQRTIAREQYADLSAASGDWGTPEPIRAAMSEWRFPEATEAIAEAAAWLVERDALVAKIAAAGLTTPARLQERFNAVGGGPDAQAELEAERAVVDAFTEQQRRAVAADGVLETIGLFADTDPRALLAEAATRFGAGELQAAAENIDRAEVQLNRAPVNGAVRIASTVVLVVVIILLVSLTIRRRAGSHYTAAP